MGADRKRERANPLPVGAWVEVTTQFDDSDDERCDLLAARAHPLDVEGAIGRAPNVFAARLPYRLIDYLDQRLADVPSAPSRAFSLNEGLRRLKVERPTWAAAVDLCCVRRLTECNVALRLGLSQALINRRKRRGLEQLGEWCGKDVDRVKVELALGHLLRRGASA